MSRLYWVVCEARGVLNPGERGFRSLDRAKALCAKEREECSWQCLTPVGQDNAEGGPTSGKFRCGVLSPHGIAVHISEDGRNIEPSVQDPDLDPEEPDMVRTHDTRHADWSLNFIVDRGTGYTADGEDTWYYTGPWLTEVGWDKIMNKIAAGDPIIEATVRPLVQGRYHHMVDDGELLVWSDRYDGFVDG